MTLLAIYAVILGILMVATRLPGLVKPEVFRRHALAFPRSVWWGRILFAVVAAWAGFVLHGALHEMAADAQREGGRVGLWMGLRTAVPLATPLAYWLVIKFGAPYLSIRAGSALLLLVGNHLVRAADMSMDASRLVVTTLVYAWVVVAIWGTVAPHHMRDAIGFLMANDQRCRVTCGTGVTLGVVLLVLGMFVY
jgi:hypothetical protein